MQAAVAELEAVLMAAGAAGGWAAVLWNDMGVHYCLVETRCSGRAGTLYCSTVAGIE